jgi:hypothetical protein
LWWGSIDDLHAEESRLSARLQTSLSGGNTRPIDTSFYIPDNHEQVPARNRRTNS